MNELLHPSSTPPNPEHVYTRELDAYRASFGNKLRAHREEREMTREALAEAVFEELRQKPDVLTEHDILRWEKGRSIPNEPQYDALEKVLIEYNPSIGESEKSRARLEFRTTYLRSREAFNSVEPDRTDDISTREEHEASLLAFSDMVERYRTDTGVSRLTLADQVKRQLMLSYREAGGNEQNAVAQLVAKDGSMFIAAIEAGHIIPGPALTQALTTALDFEWPLTHTETQALQPPQRPTSFVAAVRKEATGLEPDATDHSSLSLSGRMGSHLANPSDMQAPLPADRSEPSLQETTFAAEHGQAFKDRLRKFFTDEHGETLSITKITDIAAKHSPLKEGSLMMQISTVIGTNKQRPTLSENVRTALESALKELGKEDKLVEFNTIFSAFREDVGYRHRAPRSR